MTTEYLCVKISKNIKFIVNKSEMEICMAPQKKHYQVQYKQKETNNVPTTWGTLASSKAEAKAIFMKTHTASKYQILNVYEG